MYTRFSLTATPSAKMLSVVAVTTFLLGCNGGYNPVRGKVILSDGSPLGEGFMVWEKPEGSSMGRAMVQPDGSFEVASLKLGDGLQPGRYKVAIMFQPESQVPDEEKKPPYDHKYMSMATTDLEIEVQPQDNEISIKLDPPSKAKKPGSK